jgi:hypothetical protein
MGAAQKLPQRIHIIEVDRVGTGFSVTHSFNHKVLYTATYSNKMDAMRVATKMGAHFQHDGEEVELHIRADMRR